MLRKKHTQSRLSPTPASRRAFPGLCPPGGLQKQQSFALGCKNWLFSCTVEGAEASAILLSLVETAKANHQELYRYLRAVFEKLPSCETADQLEELLPWNLEAPKIT